MVLKKSGALCFRCGTAVFLQVLSQLVVVVGEGVFQRRLFVVIEGVDIEVFTIVLTVFDNESDGFQFVQARSKMKGSFRVRVPRVDVGLVLEQEGEDSGITLSDGPEDHGFAFNVHRVRGGSVLEQEFSDLRVLVDYGVVQRRFFVHVLKVGRSVVG